MNTYAVYDENTGALVSTGTVVDEESLPDGLAIYEFDSVSGNLDADHEWDVVSRTVVVVEPPAPAEDTTAATVAVVQQLRGKSSRTSAENRQLVDALMDLLPDDIAAQVRAT